MLTSTNDGAAALELEGGLTAEATIGDAAYEAKPSPFANVLRLEWLGQTVASVCWIASVFSYGITSTGDWLQLGAASAWLVANIAAAATTEG